MNNIPETNQAPQQPVQPTNNNALVALILGIVALVAPVLAFASCCMPANIAGVLVLFPILGLAAGIVGIILAVKAKKQGAKTTAALVMAIIGLVLSTITFFSCTLCVGCAACLGCAANDAMNNAFGNNFGGDFSDLEDMLEGLM